MSASGPSLYRRLIGVNALIPDLSGLGGCTVAVVGRPAGRFAMVDLLQP